MSKKEWDGHEKMTKQKEKKSSKKQRRNKNEMSGE